MDVRFVTPPGDLEAADLAVLPGTRATVADLAWLRERGIADAVAPRGRRRRPVLGVCGGYQMLASTITDDVESRRRTVRASACCRPGPLRPRQGARPAASAWRSASGSRATRSITGCVTVDGGEPFLDGCAVGAVRGTSWHGIFENDGFRRAFLGRVAAEAGRPGVRARTPSASPRPRGSAGLLGDLVADHLDTVGAAAPDRHGPPAGLPFVPPGAP